MQTGNFSRYITTTSCSYAGPGKSECSPPQTRSWTYLSVNQNSRRGDHVNPTPYSFGVTQRAPFSGVHRHVDTPDLAYNTGDFPCSVSFTDVNENAQLVYETAYQRFLDKLRGIDLSESLVDARQTGAMLRPARNLGRLFAQAKQRHGLIRVASSLHLQKEFGWKPLISDLFGAVSEVTRAVLKDQIVRASASNLTALGRCSVTTGANGTYAVAGLSPRGYRSDRCRFTGRFRVIPAFDQLARLTSMDPALIAYQSLRYTWLIDYVYNVSGYLKDLETRALYNSAFRGGFISTGYMTYVAVDLQGERTRSPNTYRAIGSLSYTSKGGGRSVISSLPAVPRPRLNLDLGSRQMANIAAVMGRGLPGYDKKAPKVPSRRPGFYDRNRFR